jgi:serine/threonine protein kinase
MITNGEHDPDPTVEVDAQTTPLFGEPAAVIGASATPVELQRGSILRDRYVLEERLASGGMSVVFRARDLHRAEQPRESPAIAIKLLREDLRSMDSANARLRREFRQTQALQHPGVVRMFDFDCDLGAWFITMELLEGMTLANWIKRATVRPVEPAECIRIATACAGVLAWAHAQGTVHADFKPGNVFILRSGAIKVLDFGAAHETTPDADADAASSHGAIPRVVTRAYASPEVLDGQAAEPRDDVFSLACVAYEMIAGRHPFGRVPANEARQAATIFAAPLPQLSAAQNAALASGLAWTREQRPASVQALMQSLTHDTRSTATSAAAPARTSPPSSRAPGRARAVLAASLVAAAGLAALWALRPAQEDGADRLSDAQTGEVASDTIDADAPLPGPAASTQPSGEIDPPPVARPEEAAAETERTLPDTEPPRAVSPRPMPVRQPLRVSADSASIVVSEGAPAAVVLLRRTGDLAGATRINWQLLNGSGHALTDFGGPITGTVRFLSRQATRALYVPLINDSEREDDETFSLQLSSRAAVIGPTGNVTVTIVDDDP